MRQGIQHVFFLGVLATLVSWRDQKEDVIVTRRGALYALKWMEDQADRSQEQGRADSAMETPLDVDGELSGLRIHQVTALRRSDYRTRSYFVIGAGACFVGALQLLVMMLHLGRDGIWQHRWMLAGEAVLVLGAVWGSIDLSRRAIALTRALRTPILDEPTAPPDFSTLGDGTQHIRALESMMQDDVSPEQ